MRKLTRNLAAAGIVAALGTIAPPVAKPVIAEETVERSKLLLNGFRRYHSVCNHCHGPDGLGSSFGPSLVDAPPDPEAFRAVVINGARGSSGVMKGFGDNADVMEHLDAILAYIDARARGELGRGRPR